MLNTGIDPFSIDHVILAKGYKSPLTLWIVESSKSRRRDKFYQCNIDLNCVHAISRVIISDGGDDTGSVPCLAVGWRHSSSRVTGM
jgi:hypothetical protein